MSKGIDTGTGGFPIDGGTHTYDVGSTVGDEVPVPPYSSGDVSVDKEVKDLSKGTKRTLASYLSKTTNGQTPSAPSPVKNKYAIEHNAAEDPKEFSLMDDAGNVPPIAPVPEDQPHFQDISTGRSSKSVSLNIQRGRQKLEGTTSVDGNDLLKFNLAPGDGGEVPPHVPDSSPIYSYYGNTNDLSNSVIYNRFNVEHKFEVSNTLDSKQFATKYELGKSEAKRDMSFGRLAQVGSALSIRAGLELNSLQDKNNPTNGAAQAAALLPGTAQLGLKRIGRESLTARDVIDELTDAGIDHSTLINPAADSWGTMNNVQDQYAGISNFGMQLLAVALLVALSLVIALMTLLFSVSSTTPLKKEDDLKRPPLGAFRVDAGSGNYSSVMGIVSAIMSGQFNFWRLLGMSPTQHAISKCIPVGALAFFGVNDTDVTSATMAFAAAGKATSSVTQSPGYYAVMARSVNRSFLLIGDSFVNLGKAFGSGLVAGIKQLFEVIDVLRNSKFMRAVNVFAQLGDRSLMKDTELPAFDGTSIGTGLRHFGELDWSSNTDAISKNRLNVLPNGKIDGRTLAWTTYRAPDLLIMPSGLSNVLRTGRNLNVPSMLPTIPVDAGGTTTGGLKNGGTYCTVDGRIPTDLREKIEDSLESEYVPFYIHDVRTNEIVSFHAFLASLTDGFTASYDSSDGIGRVESIKAYKSTQRKISFSFFIVATSERDFDSMWLKVNKLTTLVYPQFGEGRKIVSGDGKYVMTAPFSQKIVASPLVRVRIGDLIKSNYSKFNLARLFGYTYNGSMFDNKVAPKGKETGLGTIEDVEKEARNAVLVVGNKFTTSSRLTRQVFKKTVSLTGGGESVPTEQWITLPSGLVLSVKEVNSDGTFDCVVEKAVGEDALNVMPAQIQNLKLYSGDAGATLNIVGKVYNFSSHELDPAPSTTKKIEEWWTSHGSANISDYTNAVRDFMSDEPGKGNVIARSFRSSGGKGLAGFIEQMDFEWLDGKTWSIYDGTPDKKLGRRAPKMCKVNVSFSPIHDITPGLDHVGGNRAPIYPVGPLAFDDMRKKGNT